MRNTSPSLEQFGSQRWRVVGSEPLRWRAWAGDYVVFNPLSGQTHFLDIVTGQILKRIIHGSSSIDELCSEISTFLEVGDDSYLAEMISDILSRLDGVGLIEPVR